MTNFEKIKSLNLEEMTLWLLYRVDCELCPAGVMCQPHTSCKVLIKEWLKTNNNFEKIKSFNLEEMTKFYVKINDCSSCPTPNFCFGKCQEKIRTWLASEKSDKLFDNNPVWAN